MAFDANGNYTYDAAYGLNGQLVDPSIQRRMVMDGVNVMYANGLNAAPTGVSFNDPRTLNRYLTAAPGSTQANWLRQFTNGTAPASQGLLSGFHQQAQPVRVEPFMRSPQPQYPVPDLTARTPAQRPLLGVVQNPNGSVSFPGQPATPSAAPNLGLTRQGSGSMNFPAWLLNNRLNRMVQR